LTSRNIGLKDTTPFIQNPLRHEELDNRDTGIGVGEKRYRDRSWRIEI